MQLLFPPLLVRWCVGLLVCGCIDVGPSNATERAWSSAARAAAEAPIYALHPPLPASKAVCFEFVELARDMSFN